MKKVEVIPYNLCWPEMFARHADKIRSVLGDNVVEIHHIGSTSVPGLDSKDKIDICLQVKDAKEAIPALEKIGFEYSGEWNIPFKYGFRYRKAIKINLHMFDFDHPAMESNLLFRDYLRNNPQIREEYAALKYQILEDPDAHVKNHSFLYDYTLRKSSFIKDILRKSGFDKTYMQYCTDNEEWDVAKEFRNRYFFRPSNVEDQYVWTFNHQDHKHFAFYHGVDIIGYAHVQLWPDKRAAIRIIVIDAKHRNKGYGKGFMSLIEKWSKLRQLRSLHAESRQLSLSFFKSLGFVEMPFNDPENHESDSEDIAVGKML